jgi:hypothetical protein
MAPTIQVPENYLISLTTERTHKGNVATSRADAALHQMTVKMAENVVTPHAAQASMVCQLCDEVKIRHPRRRYTLRRRRYIGRLTIGGGGAPADRNRRQRRGFLVGGGGVDRRQ